VAPSGYDRPGQILITGILLEVVFWVSAKAGHHHIENIEAGQMACEALDVPSLLLFCYTFIQDEPTIPIP
jgi:hypothetical protein